MIGKITNESAFEKVSGGVSVRKIKKAKKDNKGLKMCVVCGRKERMQTDFWNMGFNDGVKL